MYEGGCWDHDYIPPCHSDFTWPPPSHSQAEAGGNMVGYNSSGYCDNLELESQNIADFTMSQLSQLAPVYEGDILSSALYQTILGEDSSSSYSPDSASHNGELELSPRHTQSITDLSFRAGGSPVSSGVQDGERRSVSRALILLPVLPRHSVSRHQALLQHDVSFLHSRPFLPQCSQAGE